MKRFFSDRTAGFWVGVTGAAIIFVSCVVFMATDISDRTFSWVTTLLLLAGCAFQLVNIFTNLRIAPLGASVLFGVGTAVHLYVGLPTLSDIWNGVNFIGGNPTAVIVFGALFAAGMVLSMVSCFMEQRKATELVEG